MYSYLQLLRPHQYVKNILLFLPAFFAFRIDELSIIIDTTILFVAFCFIASSVYIMNDYIDREDDRKHPEKKDRPLAAGTVQPKMAFILMGFLLLAGFGSTFYVSVNSFYLILFYFSLNIAYTFKIKHIAILDILVLALGFVLRLYIGAGAGDIYVSMWITLMIFLGALFLGLAKRRTDVKLAMEGNRTRRAIDGYNLEFINGAMIIMAAVVIVAYISYTSSPDIIKKYRNDYLYCTVIFVIAGILRYMQITFVEERSGNPSKILLKDLFLQLTILGWLATFVVLIYL
ncbi:MAG: UbiA prenyltransferase family protein [Bacteroidia bacterium]